MADKGVVVVVGRMPWTGGGKTRLAREIGYAEAGRAYRVLLGDVVAGIRLWRGWKVVVALAPLKEVAWWDGVPVVGQGGGDLGRRLRCVMVREGRGKPVVVVASDVFGVGWGDMPVVERGLRRAPVVLGGSPDGGFWLAGARTGAWAACMFRGVRWSSRHTCADVVGNVGVHRVAWVHPREDVDDAAGWGRWRQVSAKRGRSWARLHGVVRLSS